VARAPRPSSPARSPAPTPSSKSPEEAYVESVKGSRAWKLLMDCLVHRREFLTRAGEEQTKLSAPAQLAALQEVQRWIDGPTLLVEFFRQQRERLQAERTAAGEAENQRTDWWMDPNPVLAE
jgi:hypothetical protein